MVGPKTARTFRDLPGRILVPATRDLPEAEVVIGGLAVYWAYWPRVTTVMRTIRFDVAHEPLVLPGAGVPPCLPLGAVGFRRVLLRRGDRETFEIWERPETGAPIRT